MPLAKAASGAAGARDARGRVHKLWTRDGVARGIKEWL